MLRLPELPEVETIKIGLSKKIVGFQIKKIEVLNPKSFLGNPKKVEGQKVLKIWRRAKILGMELYHTHSPLSGKTRKDSVSQNIRNSDLSESQVHRVVLSNSENYSSIPHVFTLLFHLKMSGQLVYDDDKRFVGGHPTLDMRDKMPNKSTRVIFEFSNGSKLYFNDQRKFGWIKIIDNEQLSINNLFKKLGPEPLEKEFTWQILKQNLLKHKGMPIKTAIMDQTIVSGVGNIYANEACFDAKLDPRTKVNTLTDIQFKKLYTGIIKSLKDGIKHGGSSRAHFVNSEGEKGYFLDYAKVYWRDKEKCKVCGKEIKKIQLNGRGTYFCPFCQK